MKPLRLNLVAVSILLLIALALNLTGCAIGIRAQDLMDGIVPNEVEIPDDLSSHNAAVTDFALRLFKASETRGENTLVSPLSVLCALAMTANGAQAQTLEQMEATFGIKREELNLFLYGYIKDLAQGEKYKLKLANSIWFTDDERFAVCRDFLQTNADYYGADIYKAPFNDQTLKDINKWVGEKTDGMIPKILDEIPYDAVMYLVNALAFEAEWIKSYNENQVREGRFTKENGDSTDVEFMYGTESFYLEDDRSTGFIKKYTGGRYAFAAILPNEDISISEYVASLEGEALYELLSNRKTALVHTSIPKFKSTCSVEMSDVLKDMGMTRAFDEELAEFTDLGTAADGNVYIGKVIHKTFISVGEKGTKAGAATVVEMDRTLSADSEQEIRKVYLDRPFIYMIIDYENNIPLFIGTMMDTTK